MFQRLKDWGQGKAPLGATRSSKWPKVRAEHIKNNPECAVCRGTKNTEVHHKKPYHLNPELELDPENLITLCESGKNGVTCHLLFGHLGNYKSVNKNIDIDCALWYYKLKNRP